MLAGITYRQLDYWVRSGVITPAAIADPYGRALPEADRWFPGTGRHRRFTAHQAAVLEACGSIARICADTPALAALVAVCEDVALPATVAIDAAGTAHVLGAGRIPATLRACWFVRVEPVTG